MELTNYIKQETNSTVVSNVEIYGLSRSIKASGNPMRTHIDVKKVNDKDLRRATTLAQTNIGEGHDNYLNGITVMFDLTFTNKAWVEAERYHFLEFVSSQSTMHCITKFDLDKQCNEYVDYKIMDIVNKHINVYNENPSPENYLRVLYNVPSGFKLTATMITNYRQLKTIYVQRKNHRLPEWREFCKWIETLPMAQELIVKKEKENE